MDIAEFLTTRYNEDEDVARRAAWSYQSAARRPAWGTDDAYCAAGPFLDSVAVCHASGVGVAIARGRERAAHIVRHDPARVLADLAAKRRVLKRHTRGADTWMARWHPDCCVGCGHTGEHADPRTRHINDCPELRDLASAYAGHPDFEPAWTVDAAG